MDILHARDLEIEELKQQIREMLLVLTTIAEYDKDDSGICPYGCDCPDIARKAAEKFCE